MSALTPHIRVLRAEETALASMAALAVAAADKALENNQRLLAQVESTAATLLTRLSTAKLEAAMSLEAEEAALAEAVKSRDGDVTYNPKGKP